MTPINPPLASQFISPISLAISDLARNSEQLLNSSLNNPSELTFVLVFLAGLLTSLGPCSLSLLPITLAYLAGFKGKQSPLIRSISFCSGIVISLVLLGSLSGLIGKIYGQVPFLIPNFVAVLAILMGLNLLGIIQIPLPLGPNPNFLKEQLPATLAPIAAGLAFGLVSSPCTTPVLAVLLAWIAKSGNPIRGVFFLSCYGFGQVIPLLLAGTAAASIPKLLALRPLSKWIPPISGSILLGSGVLSLLALWL